MATTTTESRPRAPIERTEHPHVVKSADTLGGEPRVEGTRIGVLLIRWLHEDDGETAAAIARDYGLSLAQVHDALSYAYDHPDELARHAEEYTLRSVLKRHDFVYVEGRLIPRKLLKESDVPPGATAFTWETLPEGVG